jgi:hypothetical protein
VSQAPAFWTDWRLWTSFTLDYLDWHDAMMAWVQEDYETARPMLRRFLRGNKWVRRGLAAPMLVGSYLGTPFTHILTGGYRRLRGVDLLAP